MFSGFDLHGVVFQAPGMTGRKRKRSFTMEDMHHHKALDSNGVFILSIPWSYGVRMDESAYGTVEEVCEPDGG